MTSTEQAPSVTYSERQARARADLARFERASAWLAHSRLALFLAACSFGLLAWLGRIPREGWWGAAVSAALFAVVAVLHERIFQREQRARHRIAINQRGLDRIEGRWNAFPERGEQFARADHPYSGDLDLFGPSSLFQLLDATGTALGEQTLAAWLLAPAPRDEVRGRQEAVRELAGDLEWREALQVEGLMLSPRKPLVDRLLRWATAGRELAGRAWGLVALLLPLATLAAWGAGRAGWAPSRTWLVGLALQVALLLATRRKVARLFEAASAPGERLSRFSDCIAVLERARWKAPLLVELTRALEASGAPPSVELGRLVRILGFLQLREQPLFHLPLNAFTLWDLHWAGALERWRDRCGGRVAGWFEALARAEALSSLAGLAFDNPHYAMPELSEGGATYVAEGLGHPLLPAAHRVCNDVALGQPGTALLVTGSNMSGKTTLLRSLGINAVLAQAGAPVCARRLVLSPVGVCTSMRVRDSLAEGLSFFYAEVRRLKLVLEVCARGPGLFLLDEVLSGTNTAERQLASRAILLELLRKGAIGAVATHDLQLTTLEAQTEGRVRNVHFTDQIDAHQQMHFDFRLRPGVVATTNALALLRREGIEIPIG